MDTRFRPLIAAFEKPLSRVNLSMNYVFRYTNILQALLTQGLCQLLETQVLTNTLWV